MPGYLSILLDQYRDHPLLAGALEGDRPLSSMFSGLYAHEESLSSGEKAMLSLALALWNGNTQFRVSDIRQLDSVNRSLALAAIAARFS